MAVGNKILIHYSANSGNTCRFYFHTLYTSGPIWSKLPHTLRSAFFIIDETNLMEYFRFYLPNRMPRETRAELENSKILRRICSTLRYSLLQMRHKRYIRERKGILGIY